MVEQFKRKCFPTILWMPEFMCVSYKWFVGSDNNYEALLHLQCESGLQHIISLWKFIGCALSCMKSLLNGNIRRRAPPFKSWTLAMITHFSMNGKFLAQHFVRGKNCLFEHTKSHSYCTNYSVRENCEKFLANARNKISTDIS